jgi:hypothetical protein
VIQAQGHGASIDETRRELGEWGGRKGASTPVRPKSHSDPTGRTPWPMMPEHAPAWSSNDSAPRVAAIETSYKGYRFRSRLEARWAVFFDRMKWSWKYEPQGYDIGSDCYLPDFWVDQIGWVEVKGELDRAGLLKLALAAGPNGLPLGASDGSPTPARMGGSLPEWTWLDMARPIITRLILLGDIPAPDTNWSHIQLGLSNCRHVVWRLIVMHRRAYLGFGEWRPVGTDPSDYMPHGAGSLLQPPVMPDVREAYRAARSARFEHGESGASQSPPTPSDGWGRPNPPWSI